MNPKIRLLALAVWAAILGVAGVGCTTVEYTNRSQMMFYDESSDISAGSEAWAQIVKEQPPDPNSAYLPSLQRVGSRIAAVAERPSFRWEFAVIPSKEVNAFALPGGKVAFYEPIFVYFANDAELATVVGHEVAHALARHGMEGQSRSVLQSIGALPLMVLFDSKQDTESAVNAYMALTNVGAMLPYSRLQEYEADRIGMILMAKAGYDPAQAIPFWEKFGGSDSSGALAGFFSTHPRGAERIAEMRRNLPEAQMYYRRAANQYGKGEAMVKK